MAGTLTTIIFFIVIGIIISIVLRVLRKTFKWFIYFWILLVVLGVGLSYLIITDINDLKENLPTKEKLVLFDLDGKLVAGFYFSDVDEIFGNDNIVQDTKNLRKPDLDKLNGFYADDDMDSLSEMAYEVFILKEDMFTDVSEVQFGDITVSKEDIFSIMRSDSALEDFLDKFTQYEGQREVMREEIQDDLNAKNILLFVLFSKAQEKGGATYLVDEFKEDNLVIYKESITMKLIKLLPGSIIANFIRGE